MNILTLFKQVEGRDWPMYVGHVVVDDNVNLEFLKIDKFGFVKLKANGMSVISHMEHINRVFGMTPEALGAEEVETVFGRVPGPIDGKGQETAFRDEDVTDLRVVGATELQVDGSIVKQEEITETSK